METSFVISDIMRHREIAANLLRNGKIASAIQLLNTVLENGLQYLHNANITMPDRIALVKLLGPLGERIDELKCRLDRQSQPELEESTLFLDENEEKQNEISNEDVATIQRDKLIMPATDRPFIWDVVGLENAKHALLDYILVECKYPVLLHPDLKTKGILLFGLPGSGKTELFRATRNEVERLAPKKVTFLNVKMSQLVSAFHGITEKNIDQLFSTTEANYGLTVIFLDEIDAITGKRREDEKGDVRRVKNSLLAAMDGAAKLGSVLVAGCTNLPSSLDEAFIRRFPKRIYIELPNKEQRLRILKKKIELVQHSDTISERDMMDIAIKTEGYSPDDLTKLVCFAHYNLQTKYVGPKLWQMVNGSGQHQSDLRYWEATGNLITRNDLIMALQNYAPTNKYSSTLKLERFNREFGTDKTSQIPLTNVANAWTWKQIKKRPFRAVFEILANALD